MHAAWTAGTVWTATSHIVAVVAGSGVLALPWTVAQLGWVLGPLVLVGFSCVTYYTSALLADCYRYPDPVHGAVVNRQYVDAVRCYLGMLWIDASYSVYMKSSCRLTASRSMLMDDDDTYVKTGRTWCCAGARST
jgi:hypothetical protein